MHTNTYFILDNSTELSQVIHLMMSRKLYNTLVVLGYYRKHVFVLHKYKGRNGGIS